MMATSPTCHNSRVVCHKARRSRQRSRTYGRPSASTFELHLGLHVVGSRDRLWDRPAFLAQTFDVKCHCLPNKPQGFFSGFCNHRTARQIGHVGAEAVPALFHNHQVLHYGLRPFSPACFRMLFSVPGGTSRFGLPATVTVPGLTVCLNCWWLPAVLTSLHPSSCSIRMISRNFTPLA